MDPFVFCQENCALSKSMTLLSSYNALVRTSEEMGGFDPKTAFAIVLTPGFWLLKPAKSIAYLPNIKLEVNRTFLEQENIFWIQRLCKEAIF